MNKTKIDWCDYSWNTITGCKNGCWYCYAKKIRHRFFPEVPFEQIANYDERLDEPLKRKKPCRIFVGSMTDLFAKWQPRANIKSVLKVVRKCPQHTFIFLTKNPHGYKRWKFPQNCWLGTTITSATEWGKVAQLVAYKGKENLTFASVEPILDDFNTSYLYLVDWIILGALTGQSAENTPKIKKVWLNTAVRQCKRLKIPLFMKSSLAGIWGKTLIQNFPTKRRFS
jgi:protein gp37